MTKFEPGDIVRLKSGGPDMTVCSVSDSDDTVSCAWFDDQKKHYVWAFPSATLEMLTHEPWRGNNAPTH